MVKSDTTPLIFVKIARFHKLKMTENSKFDGFVSTHSVAVKVFALTSKQTINITILAKKSAKIAKYDNLAGYFAQETLNSFRRSAC